GAFLIIIASIAVIISIPILAYFLYRNFYFQNNKFLTLKTSINTHIQNCNDLNDHIDQLKSSFIGINTYDFGHSELIDKSNYNFKRKEWENNTYNHHIYN